MGSLYSFRKGWERENLARYVLSRIAFVAQPSTVSDDVGSDFFCTLFHIRKRDKHKYLMPKCSFAIQIKSAADPFDATKQIAYLNELELPFLVGVISEQDLSLGIYSGEYLAWMASYVGRIKKLIVSPVSENPNLPFEPYEVRREEYKVFFPKITDIKVSASVDDLMAASSIIYKRCCSILDNIAARRNKENIFQYGEDKIIILAGSGSAKVFRENFCKRLAECFCNLRWLVENQRRPSTRLIEELAIYETTYRSMERLLGRGGEAPSYLAEAYNEVKSVVSTRANHSAQGSGQIARPGASDPGSGG